MSEVSKSQGNAAYKNPHDFNKNSCHILTYGPMKMIITDMGTEYKNALVNDLCKYLKIDNITSTAYHHQTLGTIERSHRTFNEYVRSYISVDKDDWDVWLTYFTYCFNTTPSVVHGYCPYELVFGRIPNNVEMFNTDNDIAPLYNVDDYSKEVRFRLEIAYRRVRQMIDRAKFKQKEFYDEKSRGMKLEKGDLVLIRNEAGHKLESKYLGPFKVIDLRLNGNVIIEDNKKKKQLVHRDRSTVWITPRQSLRSTALRRRMRPSYPFLTRRLISIWTRTM